MICSHRPSFYEFFAGGGMARAGLGNGWDCIFSNDFDRKKSETYRTNWGYSELITGDVRQIKAVDLPGIADLAWASFPCQDLSLAGGGAGLKGDRSGTFWPFWNLMRSLIEGGRGPKSIVLENVIGTLSSHAGADFDNLCSAVSSAGYIFGAIVMDARSFVPQSRPRLFIVAFRSDIVIASGFTADTPGVWHTPALIASQARLPKAVQAKWRWWTLPTPNLRKSCFADLVEENPVDVSWHTAEETTRLLEMMSPLNLLKMETVKALNKRVVGCVYKRTRVVNGIKYQRAEVRFDDIAGCLRTPSGGSSRQVIVVIEKGTVRSRLISARETARLMGLPDTYKLPSQYNEAYHLTGDGVAVPVVRYLAAHLLEPALKTSNCATQAA